MAPGVNLRGYGHYHETYEKVDGQWRITSSKLTRLREDIFNAFVSVYLSDRIKKAAEGRRACWCDEQLIRPVGEIVATLQNSRVQVEQGGRPHQTILSKHLSSTRRVIRQPSAVRMNSSSYQSPQNRIWLLLTAEHHRVEADGPRRRGVAVDRGRRSCRACARTPGSSAAPRASHALTSGKRPSMPPMAR